MTGKKKKKKKLEWHERNPPCSVEASHADFSLTDIRGSAHMHLDCMVVLAHPQGPGWGSRLSLTETHKHSLAQVFSPWIIVEPPL